MEFQIGRDIRVSDPTPEILRWCRKNAEIENPDYIKKVRMGQWLGNTPKTIALYEMIGDQLSLPFGFLNKVFALFHNCPFKPVFKPVEAISYGSRVSLYPYQEKAVNEALKAKNGVIVMPCGAGKTQTALEIVSRIGGRCLWLTHTHDLLNQSMNRAKACYDLPNSEYGEISGGKVNIRTITFATVQTMCRLDLQKYENVFDVIVVDECHRCIGSPTRVMQFYKVLTSLCARYKFGLTATPSRADGLEASMFAIIGDVIHEVSREEVKATTCPVKILTYETHYQPNLAKVLDGDGTLNYTNLVNDLVENEERFQMVMRVINRATEGATLVLANRVSYLEDMNDFYEGKSVCLSSLRNTKAEKEKRKEALRKLNDGEIDCIFATYQLAKEGLDVPNLRCVVLATPEKDETTVTQAVGRVGRKADGKDFGFVIDLVDEFGMLKGWAKKRKKYYKALGYEVYDDGEQ